MICWSGTAHIFEECMCVSVTSLQLCVASLGLFSFLILKAMTTWIFCLTSNGAAISHVVADTLNTPPSLVFCTQYKAKIWTALHRNKKCSIKVNMLIKAKKGVVHTLNQSLSPIPSSCDAMSAGSKGWRHGGAGEALPVKWGVQGASQTRTHRRRDRSGEGLHLYMFLDGT